MRAWIIAALLALGFGGASFAEESAGAVGRGKQVFEYWCATCHGLGAGKGGTAALAFKYQGKKPALLEERTDLTPAITRYTVRHGVSIMPFFRKVEISNAELDDLSAYLARNTRK